MNNTKKASKTTPQLSIVFPNWNGVQAALEYLGSIQNSSYSREKIEVILVDNHSEDDSVSQVRKKFPEVKIIELDKNYGPAYARNRGIEQAQGEYVFCSDNDQNLDTNCLQIMADYLRGANRLQINSDIGIVGAKVLSKTKPHQIVSCGYTFNRWLGAESGRKDCKEIKECDWIAGCCMMFRNSLINEIGLFDEKFFFFAEDADFCLRTKKAGYKVVSLPDAIVYHGKNKSQALETLLEPGFGKYYDYYKAKFRLILKHSRLLQKVTSIALHLTVLSLIRYLTGKEESLVLKTRALVSVIADFSPRQNAQ